MLPLQHVASPQSGPKSIHTSENSKKRRPIHCHVTIWITLWLQYPSSFKASVYSTGFHDPRYSHQLGYSFQKYNFYIYTIDAGQCITHRSPVSYSTFCSCRPLFQTETTSSKSAAGKSHKLPTGTYYGAWNSNQFHCYQSWRDMR